MGRRLPSAGLIPDLDHYKGSFGGRVFPLWADAGASKPNVQRKLIDSLASRYGQSVTAEDVFAYIAGIAAHPAYTAKFQDDLTTPGLRIPFTADADTLRPSPTSVAVWSGCIPTANAWLMRNRGGPKALHVRQPTAAHIPKDGAIPPHAAAAGRIELRPREARLWLATDTSTTYDRRLGLRGFESGSSRSGSATGSATAASPRWATSARHRSCRQSSLTTG